MSRSFFIHPFVLKEMSDYRRPTPPPTLNTYARCPKKKLLLSKLRCLVTMILGRQPHTPREMSILR